MENSSSRCKIICSTAVIFKTALFHRGVIVLCMSSSIWKQLLQKQMKFLAGRKKVKATKTICRAH